jgi:triacylglycerol lipase
VAISDSQAVPFGLLAMYAEDMYSANSGTLAPAADPRIAGAGWTIRRYLTAQDALIPAPDAPRQTLAVNPMKRVFFGFVAENNAVPGSYVAAIRGTDGIVEWIIDAEFVAIPHPRHPGAMVEQGFWNIYQTMSMADAVTGVTTHQNAAEGLEELVGENGTVVVTGHSLGSALATYFTEDLSERLGPRVSACLFASPRTGNSAWASLFNSNVAEYRLFNYVLDLVTHVPTTGYAVLPKVTVIQPSTAKAGIHLSLLCDHHVICYCAMIDAVQTASAPTTLQDANCKACILASPPGMPQAALALADLVNALGFADERAVAVLRSLLKRSAEPIAVPATG